MSKMRGGIKRVVGSGPQKKQGTLSKVLSYLLLAAAIGVLAYRFLK